ncbi:MAG: N-formylglutamate amidohydrolase [Pseudomonadota bacterium]|nr:N-formylglutamate amidohydrolase [Pseudomonadota bacterium]
MNADEAACFRAELTPPFLIERPARPRAPFVFNSPHSGRIYPKSFLSSSRLDPLTLRKSEDSFVEQLFSVVVDRGAPLMHACFPRAFLDVNREPYELDPALIADALPGYANTRSVRVVGGLGTIARIVTETDEIYREPMTLGAALERINTLYKPYHDALGGLVSECRARFGVAMLVDCHSMPSNSVAEPGATRPDIVLGDRFGTSCDPELTRFAAQRLRDLGFAVALNKPYAGGFITEHYGRPEQGLHAMQIEVNRALYMDEGSFAQTDGFDALRAKLGMLVDALFEAAPQMLKVPRAAAE